MDWDGNFMMQDNTLFVRSQGSRSVPAEAEGGTAPILVQGADSYEDPKVSIRIIGQCNFRCPACCTGSSPSRKGILSPDDFERVVDILAEERFRGILNLSGGEPTLHPDLPDMLALLASRLPENRVILFTNGSWIGQPDWRRRLTSFLSFSQVTVRLSLDRHHVVGALRASAMPRVRASFDYLEQVAFRRAQAFLDHCVAGGGIPGRHFDVAFKGDREAAQSYLAPLGEAPVYCIELEKKPEKRAKKLGYLAVDLDDAGYPMVYLTLGHVLRNEPFGGIDALPKALAINREALSRWKGTARP
ncbi:MAG: radical SAM protein [Candidatus Contendobacter sp.]|nr:radical SAM protein [Candidatus Contendobacter sp.]MDG4556204.1 radical SAM protein [Candidatus Contendobacter sp.]